MMPQLQLIMTPISYIHGDIYRAKSASERLEYFLRLFGEFRQVMLTIITHFGSRSANQTFLADLDPNALHRPHL